MESHSGADKSTTSLPPKINGVGISSEGGAVVETSTDSTEISTINSPSSPDRSSNSNSNGVDNELKEGMANLNVSPPRPGASGSVFTLTTPLTTPQNREGTGIDAMTSSGVGAKGSVGLVRQRSSPSLIDLSPPKPKNDVSASKSRIGQPPLANTSRIAYSPKPSISMTTTTTTTAAAAMNIDTRLPRNQQLQLQRPHHELTPVTRNTTYVSDEQFVENASSNLISPEELKQAAGIGGATTLTQPVRNSGGTGVDHKLVFPPAPKDPTNSAPSLQQRLSQKHMSANNMDTQNINQGGGNNAATSGTPYLPPTIISTTSRAKSVGNLDSHTLMLATKPGTRTDSWDYAADVEHDLEDVEEEGHRGPPLPSHHLPPRQQQHPHDPPSAMYHRAIQFPPRQYYSFTSRQQYETSIQEELAEMTCLEKTEGGFIMSATSSDDAHQMDGVGAPSFLQLKPYQPDRHDLDQVGVRKDDANLLFRGKENASINGLRQPIPMEDRQYSIPSIRMAHHVNGSMTSYTDEEDDLMFRGYDDDASLSSRGSSLYLPEDVNNTMGIPATASGVGLLGSTSIVNDDDEDDVIQDVQKNTSWPVYNMQNKTSVIIEDGLEKVVHPSTSNIIDASAMAIAPSARGGVSGSGTTDTDNSSSAAGGGSRKNKRKQISQEERTLQAYQWINSIQLPAEQNVFAEAASSKFLLTGRQPPVQQQQNLSSTGVATSTEVIGGIHRRRIPPTPTAPAIADS